MNTKAAVVALTIFASLGFFFGQTVNAQGRLLNPRPVTLDREVSIYSEGVDVCGVYQPEASNLYASARRTAVSMQIGGQYSFLYQVSTPSGGGPLSALIDPTGSGMSFPIQATVKTNVAGTAGILVNPPDNGKFPFKANLTIELPANLNCVGSGGLCLMIIANGQGVGSCIFFRVLGGFSSYNGFQGGPNQYPGGNGAMNSFMGGSQAGNAGYENNNAVPGGYQAYDSYSDDSMTITSERMDELQRSFNEQQKRVSNLLYYRYDPADIKPQIMSLLDVYMEIPEYLRDPILPYSQLRLTATQVLQLAKIIPQNLIPRELYAEARRVLLKYLEERKAAQAKKSGSAGPGIISNLASSGIRATSL